MSNKDSGDFVPTLYYYEHCPYCIRVLVFAGLANISLNKVVLANDDEETPISMVGAKILPILETEPDVFMTESLNIIRYLSESYQYSLGKDEKLTASVTELIMVTRIQIYSLMMPRCIKVSLDEFKTTTAIDYFVKKKTATIGDFTVAMDNSQFFIEELSVSMRVSSALFEELTQDLSSEASITLFSALYGISYVKDFPWPLSAKTFMYQMAVSANLPVFEETCNPI